MQLRLNFHYRNIRFVSVVTGTNIRTWDDRMHACALPSSRYRAHKIDRLEAFHARAHTVRAMRIDLTKDANIYTSLGPGVQLSRLAAFYLAR